MSCHFSEEERRQFEMNQRKGRWCREEQRKGRGYRGEAL
jgi:hypothetical protein